MVMRITERFNDEELKVMSRIGKFQCIFEGVEIMAFAKLGQAAHCAPAQVD